MDPETLKARDDGWIVVDQADVLRHWGRLDGFQLPPHATELMVGAAADCNITLHDPTGCVSRHHARLTREGGVWTVRDLDSRNGIYLDGERRLSLQLVPGAEVEIGGVKLIAESPRLRLLHAFCQRVIGWRDERREDVDRALRAVRMAATRGSTLALCGGSGGGTAELEMVARRLHDLSLGSDRPFVVANKHVRAKLDDAATGTLWVHVDRPPRDLAAAITAMRTGFDTVRLVIAASTRRAATTAMASIERTVTVEVPALATRVDELERLILAYAADAVSFLGAPSTGFREHEMSWLRRGPLVSHNEVEELGQRVVAVRTWGMKEGARRLGMTHGGLGHWLRRRDIPT